MKRTSRALTALALGGSLAVAGCSSSQPIIPTGPTPGVSTQGGATTGATSASNTSAAPVGGPTNEVGPIYTKDNIVAGMKQGIPQPNTVHVVMDVNGASGGQQMNVKMTGDMETAGSDSKLSMTMEMQGISIKMLLVDKTAYLNMGSLSGNKYAVVKTDSSDPSSKQLLEMLDMANPAKQFETFEQDMKDLKFVGVEEVDGEKMNLYEMTFETSTLPSGSEYQVWLDSKSRIRKVSVKAHGMESKMTMSKWGEPVTIEAPPVSEQTTMPMS